MSELEELSAIELKNKLKELNMSTKGSKMELLKRIRAHEHSSSSPSKANSTTNEGDADSDDDSDTTVIPSKCKSHAFTFRDVEDSLRVFTGTKADAITVEKWLVEFEENAELFKWNAMEKFLYARKLIKGLARDYLLSLSQIKTYRELKDALLEEFHVEITSAEIHKQLRERKKAKSESVRQFIYAMQSIANMGDIDDESLVMYIVENIGDSSPEAMMLYDAKDMKEFKAKMVVYEKIKKRKENECPPVINEKHSQDFRSSKNRCRNCGSKTHKRNDCPDKDKGSKCFRCNEYGHIASQCSIVKEGGQSSTKTNGSSSKAMFVRNQHDVMVEGFINQIKCKMFIDTMCDFNLMQYEQFEGIQPSIDFKEVHQVMRGLGGIKVQAMGTIETHITINDTTFNCRFHVMPKNTLEFPVLLGLEFLRSVDYELKPSGVKFKKLNSDEEDNYEMMSVTNSEPIVDESPLVMVIDAEPRYDLSHIENKEVKNECSRLIESYEPNCEAVAPISMKIMLIDDEPVYERPRRVAISEKKVIDAQIEDWLKLKIIRPSNSPYASPIVMVPKKDGTKRLCIDYRKLNQKIIRENQPMPIIEEVVDKLQGATFFSTLDLENGFFHVPIDEESCKYTSFVTTDAQYEFLRVPFGLSCSPLVFTRFVRVIFKELERKGIVISYMDDLVVPATSLNEGLVNLKLVLETAAANGLRIKWKKCQFLMQKIEFLGYVIENNAIKPSEVKVKAIKNFPLPISAKKMQSFLGLCGYFRKFMPGFAKVAKPLSDLLRKDAVFKLDEKHLKSINDLKELICCNSVLRMFRNGAETEVHTDASQIGYGAALLQRCPEDGKMHPVSFMSRKTTPAEQNYHSYELEVLAIIAALKKYRIYLLGNKFKIVTDCKAFELTMKKKDLVTRVARWVLALQEFDYQVEHRPGSSMKHVDALSRVAMVVTNDTVSSRMKMAQMSDERIRIIKELVINGGYKDYLIEGDILFKAVNGQNLIVVPEVMFHEVIKSSHDVGHFGVMKTKELIERNYFIPKVQDRIHTIISNCVKCILVNRKRGKQEGFLNPIPKGEVPLETLHIDHLGPLESTDKRYKYLFVVVDGFSKYTWLFPTKTTNHIEVIQKMEIIAGTFGYPARIVSDRGAAFTSQEFKEYCDSNNVNHVSITTGVARANGQVEVINGVIVPVLSRLAINDPTKWFKFVQSVQTAINTTYQRSIKRTPFELLVGVRMRTKEYQNVVEVLQEELAEHFTTERNKLREEASKQIMQVQEENRRTYDQKRKEPLKYKVNDLVAIKRTQFGASKLKPKFMGPYRVLKVKSNNRYDVEGLNERLEGPRYTSSAADFMKPWSNFANQANEVEADLVRRGRDVGVQNPVAGCDDGIDVLNDNNGFARIRIQ